MQDRCARETKAEMTVSRPHQATTAQTITPLASIDERGNANAGTINTEASQLQAQSRHSYHRVDDKAR